ncbi:unnamed protein product [Closterium sp. Naga37s-1]|nr:unnamed protein product [Closterium sp. Naga37s-1]
MEPSRRRVPARPPLSHFLLPFPFLPLLPPQHTTLLFPSPPPFFVPLLSITTSPLLSLQTPSCCFPPQPASDGRKQRYRKAPGKLAAVAAPSSSDGRKQRYREAPGKLAAAVAAFNEAQPPLSAVVTLGDIVDGRDTEEATVEDFRVVLGELAKLHVSPVHHAIGNHCLYVPRCTLLSSLHLASPYYSTTLPNHWKLLVLDSMDVSLKWPCDSENYQAAEAFLEARRAEGQEGGHLVPWNGAVGRAQMEWLLQELRLAEEHGERVVVALHHPVAVGSAPDDLLAWNHQEICDVLVNSPPVALVLAGRYHPGGYVCMGGNSQTIPLSTSAPLSVHSSPLCLLPSVRLTLLPSMATTIRAAMCAWALPSAQQCVHGHYHPGSNVCMATTIRAAMCAWALPSGQQCVHGHYHPGSNVCMGTTIRAAMCAWPLPSGQQCVHGHYHPGSNVCMGTTIRAAMCAWPLPSGQQCVHGHYHPGSNVCMATTIRAAMCAWPLPSGQQCVHGHYHPGSNVCMATTIRAAMCAWPLPSGQQCVHGHYHPGSNVCMATTIRAAMCAWPLPSGQQCVHGHYHPGSNVCMATTIRAAMCAWALPSGQQCVHGHYHPGSNVCMATTIRAAMCAWPLPSGQQCVHGHYHPGSNVCMATTIRAAMCAWPLPSGQQCVHGHYHPGSNVCMATTIRAAMCAWPLPSGQQCVHGHYHPGSNVCMATTIRAAMCAWALPSGQQCVHGHYHPGSNATTTRAAMCACAASTFSLSTAPLLPLTSSAPTFSALSSFLSSLAPSPRLLPTGHYHPGGYVCMRGKHFLTLEAILEAPEGSEAHGIMDVYGDRIELRGSGFVKSRVFRLDQEGDGRDGVENESEDDCKVVVADTVKDVV